MLFSWAPRAFLQFPFSLLILCEILVLFRDAENKYTWENFSVTFSEYYFNFIDSESHWQNKKPFWRAPWLTRSGDEHGAVRSSCVRGTESLPEGSGRLWLSSPQPQTELRNLIMEETICQYSPILDNFRKKVSWKSWPAVKIYFRRNDCPVSCYLEVWAHPRLTSCLNLQISSYWKKNLIFIFVYEQLPACISLPHGGRACGDQKRALDT